ncbi:MAG: hypothetical protein NTW19_17795 [Planctomycetota bacterium]|nr:hypothetical protein [Planctomycetota bacterium]
MLTRLALPALREAIAAESSGGTGGSGGLSVVQGAVPAALLLRDDPSLHPALARGLENLASLAGPAFSPAIAAPAPADPALRDPAGHSRKVYFPLVLHLHLAATLARQATLPRAVLEACAAAVPAATASARRIEAHVHAPPPPALTTLALWQALCLHEAAAVLGAQESLAPDEELGPIDAAVSQIVARPGPDGSLHPRDAEESLDAWTYRELSGLHALAALALARRNAEWSARVEQIALHHLDNTQPDHTTSQPWALFAFLWSPKTRVFAEQQIHDATAQGAIDGHGLDALPAMLLADAVASLSDFLG